MSCQNCGPSLGPPALTRARSKRFIYSDDDAPSPDSSARPGSSSTCSAAATACDGRPSSPASSSSTSSLLTSLTRQISIFTTATVSSRDWGEDHLEEIEGLPAFTRDLLVRASCIGSYFDDYVIKQVMYLPCIDDEIARTPSFWRRSCFAKAIADAEKLGIVKKVGPLGYQFRSTSLLEAFYARLPRESREEVHLEIGRAMKKGLRRWSVTRPSLCLNYKMFQCSARDMTSFVQRYFKSAAEQLEQGKGLVSTQEELEEISSLNDRATELSLGGKRRARKIVYLANTF